VVETQSAVGESSHLTSKSVANTLTTTTTSEATFDELTKALSELKADDSRGPSQRESHSCCILQIITVSTVVLNCCKGDKPSQWQSLIIGPL